MMSLAELYAEAKTWQQGIGALMGFMGLMIAALWNFKLNRRRDAALRLEEMKSVAAALYGEMRMLRARVAATGQAVARLHVALGFNGRHSVKFDSHFVEANKLPDVTLYKALASKFGLLPPDLLIPIISFYENVLAVETWLPKMGDDPSRGYVYSPLHLLEPARDAVVQIVPALQKIEGLIGVPTPGRAGPLDIERLEGVIAWEAEQQRISAEQDPA
jgi:hypothetical protein